MGISGLLPVLAPITKPVHISELAGKRVAVDAFVWLHKGAYGCSFELGQRRPTDTYVKYCMNLVGLLQHHGVIPVLVFDGAPLPAKRETNRKRAESREQYKSLALGCLREGNRSKALEYFQKAIEITPELAHGLIRALKQHHVEFIVAPYEADAQLAYLALNGHVEAVISEDSDLLAYGCPRVLFKMDKLGNAQQICLRDLGSCTSPNLTHYTHEMFRYVCILAGCDYLPSPKNMGVKTAISLLSRTKDIQRLLRTMRVDRSVSLPADYEEQFYRANLTFLHQRVYDPVSMSMVSLTKVPDNILQGIENESELDFLGPMLDAETVRLIAQGEMNPFTRELFAAAPQSLTSSDGWRSKDRDNVDGTSPAGSSLSTPTPRRTNSFTLGRKKSGPDVPVQKNKISMYFASTKSPSGDSDPSSGRVMLSSSASASTPTRTTFQYSRSASPFSRTRPSTASTLSASSATTTTTTTTTSSISASELKRVREPHSSSVSSLPDDALDDILEDGVEQQSSLDTTPSWSSSHSEFAFDSPIDDLLAAEDDQDADDTYELDANTSSPYQPPPPRRLFGLAPTLSTSTSTTTTTTPAATTTTTAGRLKKSPSLKASTSSSLSSFAASLEAYRSSTDTTPPLLASTSSSSLFMPSTPPESRKLKRCDSLKENTLAPMPIVLVPESPEKKLSGQKRSSLFAGLNGAAHLNGSLNDDEDEEELDEPEATISTVQSRYFAATSFAKLGAKRQRTESRSSLPVPPQLPQSISPRKPISPFEHELIGSDDDDDGDDDHDDDFEEYDNFAQQAGSEGDNRRRHDENDVDDDCLIVSPPSSSPLSSPPSEPAILGSTPTLKMPRSSAFFSPSSTSKPLSLSSSGSSSAEPETPPASPPLPPASSRTVISVEESVTVLKRNSSSLKAPAPFSSPLINNSQRLSLGIVNNNNSTNSSPTTPSSSTKAPVSARAKLAALLASSSPSPSRKPLASALAPFAYKRTDSNTTAADDT